MNKIVSLFDTLMRRGCIWVLKGGEGADPANKLSQKCVGQKYHKQKKEGFDNNKELLQTTRCGWNCKIATHSRTTFARCDNVFK